MSHRTAASHRVRHSRLFRTRILSLSSRTGRRYDETRISDIGQLTPHMPTPPPPPPPRSSLGRRRPPSRISRPEEGGLPAELYADDDDEQAAAEAKAAAAVAAAVVGVGKVAPVAAAVDAAAVRRASYGSFGTAAAPRYPSLPHPLIPLLQVRRASYGSRWALAVRRWGRVSDTAARIPLRTARAMAGGRTRLTSPSAPLLAAL